MKLYPFQDTVSKIEPTSVGVEVSRFCKNMDSTSYKAFDFIAHPHSQCVPISFARIKSQGPLIVYESQFFIALLALTCHLSTLEFHLKCRNLFQSVFQTDATLMLGHFIVANINYPLHSKRENILCQ